ncbi:MAG: NnrU family protein [Rhodobacterales bacterium]
MVILVSGIFLWAGAHWIKRLLPELRSGMDARLGKAAARGVIAGLMVLAIVMMVKGYSGAPWVEVYTPFNGARHLNNLLMLFAVILLGMGKSKGRMRTWFRHPMLTGVTVWAVAHLLVNGDLASIVLFGGLGIWAFVSRILINRNEGVWNRPEAGPVSGDIRLLVIAAVLFAVIAAIHIWMGYNPFTGAMA